jgi:hypothetical protein
VESFAPLAARVVAERSGNAPASPAESLRAYCAPALNSANLFAVSVTTSIALQFGVFTLSVTR